MWLPAEKSSQDGAAFIDTPPTARRPPPTLQIRSVPASPLQRSIESGHSAIGRGLSLRHPRLGWLRASHPVPAWKPEQAVDTKLTAHQRSVGDICLVVEEATLQRRSRLT